MSKEHVCVVKQYVSDCVSIATPPDATAVLSAVDLLKESELCSG